MSAATDKLITLLRELFQLDQPDLDFGLYRVLHARAAEIDQFLTNDLLKSVSNAFAHYRPADAAAKRAELERIVKTLREADVDPDTNPKVQALRAELASADVVDVAGLENDVFDHLYAFFRRYYAEGDFLARRVYKKGVYAIPYEGEEVALHWANRDQYYIKTSEYLRDYAFRLRPEADAAAGQDALRVHFRLADAAEGEHGNVKAAEGAGRVFVLREPLAAAWALEAPVPGAPAELTFYFEYRPATLTDWPEAVRTGKTKPPTQKDLTAAATERLLALPDPTLARWLPELRKPHRRADGTPADDSRLQTNLDRYTKRNTFDYFIHKDLGGFLRRELDFYLKSEVLRLDDLAIAGDGADALPRVTQYLSKVRVTRTLGLHIIEFLAQLEDFQKKLWLKKKFVVRTDWCLTLDRVPADLLPTVAANAAQRAEWAALYGVTDLPADPAALANAHPHLVLDTQHFPADFTARLLAVQDGDLDELTDGLLVHGENFQALNLLQERYREQVDCIYIDPPYNTDASEILYKNGYKSSSWIALMDSRLESSRPLLTDKGVLVAAIDDAQQRELSWLLTETFDGNQLGTITVRSNPSGRPTQAGYAVSHEYLLFAGQSAKAKISRLPPTEQQMARFNQQDDEGAFEWRNLRREGSNSDRSARRALYYPIYVLDDKIRVPEMEWDGVAEVWIIKEQPRNGEQIALPDNDNGDEKTWRWEGATVMNSLAQLAVRKDRSGRDYIYYKRRPNEEGVVSVSTWSDAKYSATEHGTALLKKLFGKSPFDYPKSLHAVIDAVYIAGGAKRDAIVLDYFGGSGTTGHAVMELNRRDGGHRKYVLTEMGAHIDTALLRRLKKVIYAREWGDGKPVDHTTGVSHCLKIIRLESYEDTLNNLKVERAAAVQGALFDSPTAAPEARQAYVLRYLLDVETRGSRSLLDVAAFEDPMAYTLTVKAPGTDESRPVAVDLIETFHYLLGLRVQEMSAPQTVTATFGRDGEGRLALGPDGLRPAKAGEAGGWWFRAITGRLPNGDRALLIWRKLTGDAERDNLVLDAWFRKRAYSTRAQEFDLIYVNGDSNLENLRLPDTENWKVRLMEEEFHRLLFS